MTEEILEKHSDGTVKRDNAQILTDVFNDLRRVFQAVHEYSKRVERETGLTGPQAWTMRIIAEHEPIKISDIARRMHLHGATVVGVVDRLELQGLVRRIRSSEDRRVVHVALTDKGRILTDGTPLLEQSMLISGLDTLPDRKLKAVQTGLDTLARLLKAHNTMPGSVPAHDENDGETASADSAHEPASLIKS